MELFTYEQIQRLNEMEIKIYQYVLAKKETIIYLTIRQLANQVHVSTTSILRFCHKLDCEGYKEFQEKFKRYIQKEVEVKPKNDLAEILHYFQGVNTDAFEREIQKAVELLKPAQKVIFIGLGTSGNLGKYGARYFSNFGKISFSIEDAYYPVLHDVLEETVIVALSVSGESEGVIELLHRFQKHKCKVISITNEKNSTIAKMADWNISYHLKKKMIEDYYDITSQVPVIFIIEVLARRLMDEGEISKRES